MSQKKFSQNYYTLNRNKEYLYKNNDLQFFFIAEEIKCILSYF